MKKTQIIWLIIIIVIIAIFVMLAQKPADSPEVRTHQAAPIIAEQVSDEVVENQDDTTEVAPEGNLASGSYEIFAPEKLSKANDGKVVLFFKASWCPSCRALDSDIKSSLNDIPDGVTILEVDYDTNQDLRKKYGVTTQHTLVQVDSEGNAITKWSGGGSLETIISKLQ